MISFEATIQANSNQISTDLADEMVILNLQNGVYYGLNSVGTFVWKLIQKPTSVREICDSVLRKYAVEPERCKRDIITLLQDLESHGLIEINNETAT